MPAATASRIRREIIGRCESGERYASIGRELGIGAETVRSVYQHYQRTGRVEANYEACRHTEVRKNSVIYEQAVGLKQAHPGWGAGLVWVELAEGYAEAELPSVRTLQRWFRRAGVARVPREQRPKASPQRGQRVHEVWALDAKEAIPLGDGSQVSWLTLSDEASGAVLAAELFPPQTLESGGTAASSALAPNRPASLGLPGATSHG